MFKMLPKKIAISENPQTDGQYLIHLKDVVKAYKTDAGDFLALKNVNLSIGKSEFVGVIGKSGSGKSTLINMITGIDHPTAGQMIVGGTDIYHNMGDMTPLRLQDEIPWYQPVSHRPSKHADCSYFQHPTRCFPFHH